MLNPVVGALLGTGGRNLGADIGLAAMAVENETCHSVSDDILDYLRMRKFIRIRMHKINVMGNGRHRFNDVIDTYQQ